MFFQKSSKNRLLIITAVLSLSMQIICEEKPPVFPAHLKCDQDILISYGLEGWKYPVKMDLDMCPTVEHSCCQVKDQLTIYENWAHGKEEKNLHSRFKYHYNVYSHLMDSIIKVIPIAKMIQRKLEVKKVSNCKVLARKILHFQIKEIAPKLKEAVRTMHEFFFDSYKGMYCMLCSADTHQFFDMKEKKIYYGERFCRDIVANSLHTLLYFHLHFAKFLNLVGTFLSTCDNRGRFNDKAVLSPKYTFHTKAKARNEIEKCKIFRNDPTWFKMCEPLCENFKLTKYSEFFQPHLKKYRMYAQFIDKQVRKIKHQEKNDPLNQKMTMKRRLLEQNKVNNTSKMATDSNGSTNDKQISKRILKAKPPAKKKKGKNNKKKRPTVIDRLKMGEKKWKKLGIFRSALNAIIPIDLFKSKFRDPGIELYAFGEASMIDDARAKQVKAEIRRLKGVKVQKRGSAMFSSASRFSFIGLTFLILGMLKL